MDGTLLTDAEIRTEARSILGNVAVFGLTSDLRARAEALHNEAARVENTYNGLTRRAMYEIHDVNMTFNLRQLGL